MVVFHSKKWYKIGKNGIEQVKNATHALRHTLKNPSKYWVFCWSIPFRYTFRYTFQGYLLIKQGHLTYFPIGESTYSRSSVYHHDLDISI